MYLPRALIIVDSLDIDTLDFRQLLDSAGYSTELVDYDQVSLDRIDRIQPNIIFFHISKPQMPGTEIIELFESELFSNIPLVALTAHKEVANNMFAIATVVLLLPVSEQRLVNLFSLLSSIDTKVEKNPWDELTGFYTPSFFRSRLQKALDRSRDAQKNRFIVYTINLDHLINYNLSYGIEHRRRILQGVADVLRKLLRPTDIVSRFDSNQFLVLIDDAPDRYTPVTIAGRMQYEFDDYLATAGLKDQIKIDIGVIYCNSNYLSVDEILADAQMALQMAKQDTVNSYKVMVRSRPKRTRFKRSGVVGD